MRKILVIAEKVKQDLIQAIAARQVVRAAASDTELIACFNIGQACNAFDLVRHSLLFFQLMALMRLWDTRSDVHSIETLVRLLSDAKLVTKLVERERQALHDTKQVETLLGEGKREAPFALTRSSPDQREHELLAKLSSWLGEVRAAKGCPEIYRLRNYRHDILAHSAARSHRPQIPLPYYGDEQTVLERTTPIVSEGFRLATGIYHDFWTTKSVWDLMQHDMWGVVRSAARGEKYAPTPRNVDDLAREVAEAGPITIKG